MIYKYESYKNGIYKTGYKEINEMTVPAYKRHLSPVEFISSAQELLRYTVKVCERIPKRYTFFGVSHAYELAQDILDNCIRANITNVNTNKELRLEYLNKAISSLACLSNHIQTLKIYGPNVEDRQWELLCTKLSLTEKLIKSIIRSDKER